MTWHQFLSDERGFIGTTAAILTAAAVGAGTSVASSALQSSAAKSAAQIQAQASGEALAFEKNRYDQMTAALQPYIDTGKQSESQISNLLTNPTSSAPAYRQEATVLMKAPDGSTRAIPSSQEAHWTQQGAVRLS